MNKVDRPNIVGVCGPQPNDGATFVIKPFMFLVPTRELLILFTREASYLLENNTSAIQNRQGCDFSVVHNTNIA